MERFGAHYVKAGLQTWRFRRALARFRHDPESAIDNPRLLDTLVSNWGNVAWSADSAFLREALRRAVTTDGPVLECGSGLSTLLIGILLKRRRVELWSFEHDPAWYRRMARWIRWEGLDTTHLHHTRLVDHGAFHWYELPLERMPPVFPLVICDGPPGDTPGGRSGMLPVMRDHLPPDAVIILDDTDRSRERSTASSWARELHATIAYVGHSNSIAVIEAQDVCELPTAYAS